MRRLLQCGPESWECERTQIVRVRVNGTVKGGELGWEMGEKKLSGPLSSRFEDTSKQRFGSAREDLIIRRKNRRCRSPRIIWAEGCALFSPFIPCQYFPRQLLSSSISFKSCSFVESVHGGRKLSGGRGRVLKGCFLALILFSPHFLVAYTNFYNPEFLFLLYCCPFNQCLYLIAAKTFISHDLALGYLKLLFR